MKNNKNKFFLMILIIISLFFLKSQKVLAENNTSEYTIDAYDINIIVNEDDTYKIIETIQTSFYVPKHGIYRKIPLRNKVTRPDGTISNNNAKIKELEVDNQYSISTAIT